MGAEVNEHRALHRGPWHSSDDTLPFQQWEVKGKNNRVLAESGDVTQQRQIRHLCLRKTQVLELSNRNSGLGAPKHYISVKKLSSS